MERLLETHGEGIHHIGVFVKNMDEKIENLKKEGIEVIQKGITQVEDMLTWKVPISSNSS